LPTPSRGASPAPSGVSSVMPPPVYAPPPSVSGSAPAAMTQGQLINPRTARNRVCVARSN
jgi:hypothetical protein